MDTPARRRGSDLLVTRSADEVLVLDRSASKYHHLNPVTTFVWDRCDGATRRAALVRAVAERYATQAADQLVDTALARLETAGLLENGRPAGPA